MTDGSSSFAELADRVAVIDVLHRYAFAIDTRNWSAFRTLFTDDVIADFVGWRRWTDLESWAKDFETGHAEMVSTQHVMANEIVEIDGDEARSLCHAVNRTNRPDPAESASVGCTYDDRLVRTASGWKIAQRTCRILWRSSQNVSTAAIGPDSLWGAAAAGSIGFFSPR
jgi:3-phenylpropionate/cinnamic acid dioxygenase small subunit